MAEAQAQERPATTGRAGRRLRVFAPMVALAWLCMAIVYAALFLRHGRDDLGNLLVAVLALAAVPAMTALTLQAFGRHDTPLTSATLMTIVYSAFVVAVLSAVRLPLSYLGLFAAVPVAVFFMVRANLALQRMAGSRIAILDFDAAAATAARLALPPRILADPTAPLGDVDCLLIDPLVHHDRHWAPLLQRAYLAGIDILPWPIFLERSLGRVDVGSFDVSDIRHTPSQTAYLKVRPWIDRALVLATLPVTVPLKLAVALYLVVRYGRPVLFSQFRSGLGGRPFRIVKFRTMRRDAGVRPAEPADSRVLPGARILRRMRLDELPQLWNVLKGEMSLVGPRPETPELVSEFDASIPGHIYRGLLAPGITGWAQIRSGYASSPDEVRTKLAHDLYYIKHVSPELDLRILVDTVRIVLFGSGAR